MPRTTLILLAGAGAPGLTGDEGARRRSRLVYSVTLITPSQMDASVLVTSYARTCAMPLSFFLKDHYHIKDGYDSPPDEEKI